MARIDFLQTQHAGTARNYVERAMHTQRAEHAEIASQFGEAYWDGDRCYGYGGYHYDGRWRRLAETLIAHYRLQPGDHVLDVGCGKAYLLYELWAALPGLRVTGLDISAYALENAKEEIRPLLHLGDASALPFADASFDFVISLGTLHNLPIEVLLRAFAEIERVGKDTRKYVMVKSYRTMQEKINLLNWQLTCKSFHSPESWAWIAAQAGYKGDYGFIFFE